MLVKSGLALIGGLAALLGPAAQGAEALALPAGLAEPAAPWNLHGQFTNVTQFQPAFTAPYRGANSLDAANSTKETVDLTVFAGVRLWRGASVYLDPEIDQGYGLSGTLGAAGFPSGEAYKVGARNPYFRLPRAFVRQVIATDGQGDDSVLPDGANQLAESVPADNLIITLGKFSVVDVFDTNSYAHDPRADFMNWSLIDAGAFDYAADAWGYTYGGAVEWTRSRWTLRGGGFALSKVPNTKDIDGQFRQFSLVAEVEERHALGQQPGKLKLLGFINRGRMGRYDAALALAAASGAAPDTAAVRRYASRPGVALNAEQTLGSELGLFARASVNDGAQEAFEFTEINRSVAAGLSLRGTRWARADDTLAVALAVNGISSAARAYFAAGGMGILIGDGRLPDYGYEKIVESYYTAQINSWVTVGADAQLIANPAYNRDRGPVGVLGLRLHLQF